MKKDKNTNYEEIDLTAFDHSNTSFKKLNNRYCKPKYFKGVKEYQVKYKNAEKMAKEINFQKGDRVHALLSGNFIFGDFIEAFVTHHKIKVKRMVISTLSMSQENIDSLHNLLKWGYVEKLDLIISDFWYSHERKNLLPYTYKILDIDNKFQLAVARIHTKTVLIETEKGNFITMEGSANLRTSGNLEAIVIDSNKETFDFHLDWQEFILNKYNTIKKTVNTTVQNELFT